MQKRTHEVLPVQDIPCGKNAGLAAGASGLVRQRTAQEPSRQGAGVLAVAQQNLTTDDGGRHAARLLHEAPGARR